MGVNNKASAMFVMFSLVTQTLIAAKDVSMQNGTLIPVCEVSLA